jgi:hypothetical protein
MKLRPSSCHLCNRRNSKQTVDMVVTASEDDLAQFATEGLRCNRRCESPSAGAFACNRSIAFRIRCHASAWHYSADSEPVQAQWSFASKIAHAAFVVAVRKGWIRVRCCLVHAPAFDMQPLSQRGVLFSQRRDCRDPDSKWHQRLPTGRPFPARTNSQPYAADVFPCSRSIAPKGSFPSVRGRRFLVHPLPVRRRLSLQPLDRVYGGF